MPRTNTVTVSGKEITVSELTMQQIIDLSETTEESAPAQIVGLLDKTTSMTSAEVAALAPSDISDLVTAVLEVNKDFLFQAQALGMEAAAKSLERMIRSIFMTPFLP